MFPDGRDSGSAEPLSLPASARNGVERRRAPGTGSDGSTAPLLDPSFHQLVTQAQSVFGLGVSYDADVDAGRSGSSNLEESALESSGALILDGLTKQTGVYNIRVERYPDGWKATLFESKDPTYRERIAREPKPKDESEQWEGSKLRARREVRHKVRCISADHLWTFTKRGKFEALDELWACWKEFRRLMVRRFPQKPWIYVAVPELHADGESWHLHVGVNGFWDVTAIRVLWYRALGGNGSEVGAQTPGSVNVKWFNRGKSARSIASYVAKYVGKGMGRMPGGRRLYAASKGIRSLEVRQYHFVTDLPDVDLVAEMEKLLFALSGGSRWVHRFYDGAGYRCCVFEKGR